MTLDLVRDTELEAGDFRAIAAIMRDEARISLSPAKITLVQSRLAKRVRHHQLPAFNDYVKLVQKDSLERAHMIAALTTNHTSFFREAHHFQHLREVLLPRLKTQAASGKAVRIWSAGCSSGEEAYSIAMCLLGPDRSSADWLRGRDIRLLATDISAQMVEATQRGTYSLLAADAIPLPYRAAWLHEAADAVTMSDQARSIVTARELNLFAEWPMRQRYDAIFCRNVMIYFDDESKAELERRLLAQLAPGGFLYIGHSERLADSLTDIAKPCGQTIYVKNEAD